MRDRKTSRVLNNQSYFLGLSYSDITAGGVLLLILILIFKTLKVDSPLSALLIAVMSLAFLIPVRLNFRRKIVRDSLKYLFKKGVVNVSKNNRNK